MKNTPVLMLVLFLFAGACHTQKVVKTEAPKPVVNNAISKLLQVPADSARQAKAIALEDINRNRALLILEEITLAPFSIEDSLFQVQYNIHYEEQGKNKPNPQVIKVYNWTIFNHLNNKYGPDWTKTVRQDVLSVKDWRKYKK